MKVDFTIMLLKTFKVNFISNSIHYTPHIHSLSAWMTLHYKTSRGLAIMSVGRDPYNSSCYLGGILQNITSALNSWINQKIENWSEWILFHLIWMRNQLHSINWSWPTTIQTQLKYQNGTVELSFTEWAIF